MIPAPSGVSLNDARTRSLMNAAELPKKYRLVVPSIPDRIAEVDEFLESSLRGDGIDEGIIADMAIAVTELVNNAIDHGNAGDPAKLVKLSIIVRADEIEIEVSDEGGGFNPDSVADPLAQENLLREVGRGVFIVRHLMDTVKIESVPGQGTMVRIMKKLDAPAN